MRPMRLVWTVVSTLVASLTLRAQTVEASQTYHQLELEVVRMHQAGKLAEAIGLLKRCHDLAPRDARSAYNLACCYSLSGDVEAGLRWLESAAEYGFGVDAAELELVRGRDADLGALRSDPRFQAALRTMEARKSAVEAYAKDPIVYVPQSVKDAERVGLLVVLHDAGETKDTAFAKGPWKRLADELGLALVIPSARFPVGAEPAQGMRWFRWVSLDYAVEPAAIESTLSDALAAVRERLQVLQERTYLVGSGQGGLIAFHRAVRAPGEFRHVVVDRSAIVPSLAEPAAPAAAKAGLEVRFLIPDRDVYGFDHDPAAFDKAAQHYGEALKRWKIAGSVERYARGAASADTEVARWKAAIASFDTSPQAAGDGAK